MLSRKLGDVSRLVVEYLDQFPHEEKDAEDVIAAVGNKIMSGRALRSYEARARGNKGTGTRPQLTPEEQMASGRRNIVNDSLASLRESGYIIMEKRDGKRWVQRVTACPACLRPFPLTSSTLTETTMTTGNVVTPTKAPWWGKTGTEAHQ